MHIDPIDTTSLKAAREAAGLTHAELARRSGLPWSSIKRIEDGIIDPGVNRTWSKIVRAITDAVEEKTTEATHVDAPVE